MDIDDGLAPGGGQFQRQICRSETFCSQYLHGDHSRVHRCYALPAPIMRTMTMLHLLILVSGLRAVRSMMMTSCIAGQKLSLAAMSEFYKPRISQAKGVPVLYSTWGIVRICFLPVLQPPSSTQTRVRALETRLALCRSYMLRVLAHSYARMHDSLRNVPNTKGRHSGDQPNAACCGYGTFLSMTALTTAGYKKYADAVGGVPLVAPCGRAYELVYNSTDKAFNPDGPLATTSMFTCLYNHDLAPSSSSRGDDGGGGTSRGKEARNCIINGAGNGGHPSIYGTYLIAAVFAATIHNKPVVQVNWAPSQISDLDRDFLLAVADEAVFGSTGVR